MKLLFFYTLLLFAAFPLENQAAIAQQSSDVYGLSGASAYYNKLIINKLSAESESAPVSEIKEMKFEPLTLVEENLARNLNSHWVWPEYTLEMIDSYSPFLFRTKKSQALDEVKVLLNVDSKGKISGFEVLGDLDKGTKERLDHMIRKMPECKPVPGFSAYTPSTFELTIKK